jgi:hypothetical protein
MSIYCVTPPTPVSVPEASAPKAPAVKADVRADDASAPQPTVLAALPPGQGTRIDQIA